MSTDDRLQAAIDRTAQCIVVLRECERQLGIQLAVLREKALELDNQLAGIEADFERHRALNDKLTHTP